MGFHFDLEHANWLAHFFQPAGIAPALEPHAAQYVVARLIRSMERGHFSSESQRRYMMEFLDFVGRTRGHEQEQARRLRQFFATLPWIALLIPSERNEPVDRLLRAEEFLAEVVHGSREVGGVILQVESTGSKGSEGGLYFESVFPAFKTALREVTRWPGVLIWTSGGDSVFLELGRSPASARQRMRWTLGELSKNVGTPDLGQLRYEYQKEFLSTIQRPVRLLHLSDLHLGSRLADRRMPRVQDLIRSLASEVTDRESLVPIVTGDILDTPSEGNLDLARAFYSFLHSLGTAEPIMLLGNHDVRTDGAFLPSFRQALHLRTDQEVVFLDEHRLAIACFNSVAGGVLARGSIGERGLSDMGSALDRNRKADGYLRIAALHHHPVPVEKPTWYRRAWYERLLGSKFDTTDALVDAKQFMAWSAARGVKAILHGHRHIPRYTSSGGMVVIGCGSSVGKVDAVDRDEIYISMNMITIDAQAGNLSCRLLAERIPGGGLANTSTHELVFQAELGAATEAVKVKPRRSAKKVPPKSKPKRRPPE